MKQLIIDVIFFAQEVQQVMKWSVRRAAAVVAVVLGGLLLGHAFVVGAARLVLVARW